MATWLTHLRVADMVSERIYIANKALYFAGSLAPDCAISPDTSHWCTDGDKTTCDTNEFYSKYLSSSADSLEKDFYIGYYIHLLTDILWHQQKINPALNYPKNHIKWIKERWKRIDEFFIFNNKDYAPIKYFSGIEKHNETISNLYGFVQPEQLSEYIKICRNNCIHNDNPPDFDVYNEINNFINEASIIIIDKLCN